LDEEIDLRPYFLAVQQYMIWIILSAIIAGILSYVVANNIPQTFEATSLIAVTNNENIIQFDPRIRTEFEPQPINAYPELALSDELLSLLISQEIGFVDVALLRKVLNAEIINDGQLIKLSAKANDASDAAHIVNIWSEVFVNWVDNIYINEAEETISSFEEQVAQAEEKLVAAEDELILFQSLNQSSIISATLVFNEAKLANHLSIQQDLQNLLRDTNNFQAYLQTSDRDQPTIADQLSRLSLQLRSFNSGNTVQSPLILQLDLIEDVSPTDIDYQIESIQSINLLIEKEIDNIDTEISEIMPIILDLQRQLQESESEFIRLNRNRNLAEEAVTTLIRKVQEEEIISQGRGGIFQLVSLASIPTIPIGPNKVLLSASGSFAGLIVSFFMVIILGSKKIKTQTRNNSN
jgi:capsular polysaccharide biosynthesis protein